MDDETEAPVVDLEALDETDDENLGDAAATKFCASGAQS